MSAKQKRQTRYIRLLLEHEATRLPTKNMDTSKRAVSRILRWKRESDGYNVGTNKHAK